MGLKYFFHWCDNEQAVTASSTPLVSGKSLMGADADIIIAIHEQRKRLPFLVSVKHVYGHQDEKKRKGKKTDDKRKEKPKFDPTECPPLDIDEGLKSQFGLGATPTEQPEEEPEQTLQSAEVQINITCDELATETAKAAVDGGKAPRVAMTTLPYAGSKAMLRIGDRWVTSHHKQEIHRARHEPALRTYCLEKFKKYNWNNEVFDLVSKLVLGGVCSAQVRTDKAHVHEQDHVWLATNRAYASSHHQRQPVPWLQARRRDDGASFPMHAPIMRDHPGKGLERTRMPGKKEKGPPAHHGGRLPRHSS